MGNVQVAMLAGALYTLLRDAVFTHPTMSETLGMLFARAQTTRRGCGETPIHVSQLVRTRPMIE